MVTAAVLGAAVGVGAALVLTLTLLIYRYHAAQKKEAADCQYPYHGGSNSWSTRDSWAPAPTAPTPPPYKSTSCLLEGASNGRRRPPAKLYLPLTIHHQVRHQQHYPLIYSNYRAISFWKKKSRFRSCRKMALKTELFVQSEKTFCHRKNSSKSIVHTPRIAGLAFGACACTSVTKTLYRLFFLPLESLFDGLRIVIAGWLVGCHGWCHSRRVPHWRYSFVRILWFSLLSFPSRRKAFRICRCVIQTRDCVLR